MKDAPGYQLVGVEWECDCGHRQRSVLTTEPFIKVRKKNVPEYEAECRECGQTAMIQINLKVKYDV